MPAELHIVVPCYNEADRLDVEAFSAAARADGRLRFLFVDDGSSDGTAAVLAALAGRPRCEVLRLPRNGGKAEAVRRGFLDRLDAGAAGAIGFWDADRATPLSDIAGFARILDERPEVELVIGSRVKLLGRQIVRRQARHYVGRTAATLVSNMLGLPVYDTQCGAKLFRVTPGLRGLFAEPFSTRWAFDVELLARWIGASEGSREALERRIVEVPLMRWVDVDGSKITPADFLKTPLDLARIWLRYRRLL